MEALFIYFAKSILLSAIFWGYYKLFLEGKEFHHYNRFYLLFSVIMSLILPIIKVNWFTVQPNSENLYLLLQYMNGDALGTTTIISQMSFITYIGIFFGLVSMFFIARILFGINKIQSIKSQYPVEKHEDYHMILTDLPSAPFTFLKNLFWNTSIDSNTVHGKKIFLHELAHIRQKHTLDRLFLQITKAIFWFNPMYYLIHKEVILIHEYLADQKAIDNKDSKAFAAMLLSQHYTAAVIPGTSPFFTSTIKKRLDMLNKNHKTSFTYARRVWALPLLFMLSFVYLVQAKNTEITTENEYIENFLQQQVRPENDSIKQKMLDRKKALELNQKALQQKENSLEQKRKEIEVQQKEIEKLSQQAERKNKEVEKLLKKSDAKLNPSEINMKLDEIAKINKTIDEKINSLSKSNGGILLPPPPPPPTPPVPPQQKKHISVTSKSIQLETKDGEELKFYYDGKGSYKNNFGKDTPEIYLNGTMITEKEMLDLDPTLIKNVVIDKDRKSDKNQIKPRIDIHTINPPPAPTQRKKYRGPTGKSIKITSKDGDEVQVYHDGKGNYQDNFDGTETDIFMDGKKITREEMVEIEPENIESVNLKKDIKPNRIEIITK